MQTKRPIDKATRLMLATTFGLSLALVGGKAQAITVTRSRIVASPPAAVWALIGGFCDIARWHPSVAGCTVSTREGRPVRAIVAAGGLGTIVEIETARDEAARRYAYTFVSGPLPVKTYDASISVSPAGSGSTITWSATFEASGMSEADAEADIAGVYEAGLAGIARELAP